MVKTKEEGQSDLTLMRSHESTILIGRSILHTLNMVQNFNLLKNIKKKVGECLLFKDHSVVLGFQHILEIHMLLCEKQTYMSLS